MLNQDLAMVELYATLGVRQMLLACNRDNSCAFSHANVKAIFDHPRTIDDEQICARAAQGGVIGLTGLGIFMGDPSASVAACIRQIDYLAERIGTSHIGLGLDTELYPEHTDLPEGESEDDWWPHEHYEQMNGHKQLQPEMLGEVAQQLTRLGYAPSDISDIYGENFPSAHGQNR